MKPPAPEELADKDLEAEGMMFVGDKGKILARFHGENPQILPQAGMRDYAGTKPVPGPMAGGRGWMRGVGVATWIVACKGGKATHGDFLLGGPISDAFNLAAVSLRLGGRKLLFDAANMKITNIPEANSYLVREYREGWDLH